MPIITLPSNASMDEHPDNTQTDFITNLTTPIICEGNFEVALLELTYRQSIKTYIGKIITLTHISANFCSEDIFLHEGEHIETFVDRLNHALNICVVYHMQQPAYTEYFEYKDSFVRLINIPQNVQFQFDGNILKLFDFEKRKGFFSRYSKNEKLFTYPPNTPIRTLDEIFVYTDIIKNQYVGDTLAPLLRGVGNRGKNNETITVEFINPLYVDLNKTEIRNIHIYLRDSTGEKIYFRDPGSKVIVKLDIRPKKYGF